MRGKPTLLPRSTRGWRGFTIIELMIVVMVVGVLAAIAYPSFADSIRKSRRAEAMTALAQLQQAQERWRTNHAAYSADLAALGVPATTSSGYYALSVVAAPGPQPLNLAYVAMAFGKDNTSQANDAQCRRVAVRMLNGNLTYAGCGSCADFAATDFVNSHTCWPQ